MIFTTAGASALRQDFEDYKKVAENYKKVAEKVTKLRRPAGRGAADGRSCPCPSGRIPAFVRRVEEWALSWLGQFNV